MRVVVAADSIAGLTPRVASETIAGGFAAKGAQVAVVPLGVDGEALAEAAAIAAPEALFISASTTADVADALSRPGAEADVVLDLTGCQVDGLGAAILARFADDPVQGLIAARAAWAGRQLVALVPADQVSRPLTGLEGHASTALRSAGATLQEVLTFDARAERWLAELGLEQGPGAGAAGGVGLIVTALGGRVLDPLFWLAERYGLAGTVAQADLVVTGAELMEFHAVGGPVVKKVVSWAEEQLRPAIAIAGRNYVSSRELRIAGLETAHALREGAAEDESTPDELAAAASRLAASWAW
ncbi:glycerate kinase [Tessaracoccus sp. MC1865]|uniref:glycerate kinase n=1 Tax=Tessaracoccus sp. MC1865 TaxID=2760310 RepID=UPI001602382D|nr:glycerate kinase [Tessaracoccus sp. MC1865]MBB1483653.1 glycerate kinase [Tessaracoccus sp. MC1865]QTO36727.1 glycerate kinase [Tessaracoccus sp. MC1865]